MSTKFNPIVQDKTFTCIICDRRLPLRQTTGHSGICKECKSIIKERRLKGLDALDIKPFEEVWRTIPDFPMYQIDMNGNVKGSISHKMIHYYDKVVLIPSSEDAFKEIASTKIEPSRTPSRSKKDGDYGGFFIVPETNTVTPHLEDQARIFTRTELKKIFECLTEGSNFPMDAFGKPFTHNWQNECVIIREGVKK